MSVIERGVLLERVVELTALSEVVAAAADGRAGVGLIEGAAGIGKSRLLGEALRIAEDAGLRVLRARGGEFEQEFPFGVVRQLLEPVLHRNGNDPFAGAAQAARAVFDPTPGGDGWADPSFASLHGLFWLVVDLSADRPLVLAVDDLHWCDRPSLRFLAYLVRRMEGLPVLVLATLRPALVGGAGNVVAEIAVDHLTSSIRPSPLSEAAVGSLAQHRLGGVPAPEFVRACSSATTGNPLLLDELLKALAAEGVCPDAAHVGAVADLGPSAVSRSVLLRLHRLPEDARRLAVAVAVLGDGARLRRLAAFADLTVDEAVAAAGALTRAEIIRADEPVAFVHPLVGAAVYDDLPPLSRAAHHGRAASLLISTAAPNEQVAAHLLKLEGTGDPKVVDILRRAARTALQHGAAESAVILLDRALREPPLTTQRVEVLLELGRAEALTSGPQAAEHLAEAYGLLHDPVERATTAQALARVLLFTGHPADGAAIARAAAAELPNEFEDLRLALEAFEHLAVLFGAGEPGPQRRLAVDDVLPEVTGVGAKMVTAVAAQDLMYAGVPADRCVELACSALAGGDLIAADNGLLATCAITTLMFADRPEVMDVWEQARVDAHRRGSLFAISSLDLWFGCTLLWRGELADAEASLRAAMDGFELRGYSQQQAQIYCDAFLAAVLRERGDVTAARVALDHSSDSGRDDDGTRYWLTSNIELLLAEGRHDDALAAADDYARRFDALVRNPMDAPWRSQKARALARLDRHDEACSLVEEELVLARRWGAPGTVARSLRAYAEVEPENDLRHLHAAVEVVEGSPAALETAKSLAALGRALRRHRQPNAAREPLRKALELSISCAARGLEDETRAELSAAGGRPRRAALSGLASLTAQERRVADMAASGARNREIAQALFVTPKTVETHLSSTYRKIGVRSRHELAVALRTDL